MIFPRIKQYDFIIERTMEVTRDYVGRLDWLAYDIYGDIRYYKPLAAANNIRYPIGVRNGIRPLRESIENDVNHNNLDLTVDESLNAHNPSTNDWSFYGEYTAGAMTDVYDGRVLNIPTVESARGWLSKYEKAQ